MIPHGRERSTLHERAAAGDRYTVGGPGVERSQQDELIPFGIGQLRSVWSFTDYRRAERAETSKVLTSILARCHDPPKPIPS